MYGLVKHPTKIPKLLVAGYTEWLNSLKYNTILLLSGYTEKHDHRNLSRKLDKKKFIYRSFRKLNKEVK